MLALSPVWFSALVSSTGPGRLYSAGPGSPPGLGDLTRASSLTNKQCVGLREKPPRRCQNKSRYRTSTFRKTLKITDCELICFLVNLIKYLKRLDWKNAKFTSILGIFGYHVPLFWRQAPNMEVLSVFYLKLNLLFSMFSTLSSGNIVMFQTGWSSYYTAIKLSIGQHYLVVREIMLLRCPWAHQCIYNILQGDCV